MKIIKCDRCGKDIPDIPPYMNVVKQGVIKPTVMMTIWDNAKQMARAIDLCDDCQKAVYNIYLNLAMELVHSDIRASNT